ncbi:MAG TPA: SAM-dependent methyltransferase [Burkholderiaceae bacterium]|nr:SAM-dependent methyltransferase [Burkholderiaceae bacterium]
MKSGRLLLLPALVAESAPDEVLPLHVLETARATRHFLAERAKSARAFLKVIGHPVALQELDIVEIGHAPEVAHIDVWLRPLREGEDLALVSEAGCPAVADPGASIVARAHELGIAVHPLVGPSSLLLALMASGLEGQRFRFVGYLPQEESQLARAIDMLEEASRAGETQLFIETPYRNERLFSALLRHCSRDTRLSIALALTGKDEAIGTRTIDAWRKIAESRPPDLRNRPAVFALLAGVRKTIRKR